MRKIDRRDEEILTPPERQKALRDSAHGLGRKRLATETSGQRAAREGRALRRAVQAKLVREFEDCP